MTEEQTYLELFIKVAYSPGVADIAKGCIEANLEAYHKKIRNIKTK